MQVLSKKTIRIKAKQVISKRLIKLENNANLLNYIYFLFINLILTVMLLSIVLSFFILISYHLTNNEQESF